MTAVDLDALDKLRSALEPVIAGTLAAYGDRPWAATKAVLALAPVADLIAEARRYRALREAVEGLAGELDRYRVWRGAPAAGSYDDGVNQAQGHAAHRLRAVVATVDDEQ